MDSDGCANSDFSVAPRRVSILLALAMEGSFLDPLEGTRKYDRELTLIPYYVSLVSLKSRK